MTIEQTSYRRIKKTDKQGDPVRLVVRKYIPHPEAGVVPVVESFKNSAYWRDGKWRTLDGHLVPYENKDILGVVNVGVQTL